MEHTFSERTTGKFPGITGIIKDSPVFPLENFRWKSMLHSRVFTRNHRQFQAIHGDICATILNFGDERINEWNLCQMEHILHSMDLSMEVSERFS